ncbi:MAG: DUF1573 domain-containing protein [Chthoniobacterales bacterium]|nr:DUF1573 domain-containing protein [Chthoniobacterales bacterium]
MTSKVQAYLCAVFVSAASTAHAQLAWEKTEIELNPKAGDEEAVAHFKYENKGNTPVRITNVRTSCGCTVANYKRDELAPGEKGEIAATFKIGNRIGLQPKVVTVETDFPGAPIANLVLKANIAQLFEVQPTFVYWEGGEAPKPKTITVRAGKDVPVTKVDVMTSSPDFTTKVEKGKAQGEFVITVQPKDTARILNATLTIKPDYPKTLYASARVTGAPAAAR